MPFTRVDTDAAPPDRIIAAVWGQPKEGKTTFALSFPDPIYLFNFDQGFEELIRTGKYAGREIYRSDFLLPEMFDLDTYLPLRARFLKEWAEACLQAGARRGTVVVDTASQLDKLVRDTEREVAEAPRREKAEKKGAYYTPMQTSWGPANLMMGSLERRPYQVPGCNAVYIQRAQPEYDAGGHQLSTFKMHGFNETEAIANVVVQVFNRQVGPNTHTYGKLERTRFDTGRPWLGMEIENLSYGKLFEMLTPDADEAA